MKTFKYLPIILPSLLTIALSFSIAPRTGMIVKAGVSNWIVSATAPIDEDYEYVYTIDADFILNQDSGFPSEHDVNSIKPVYVEGSTLIAARSYIGLDEFEQRVDYITIGDEAFDTFDNGGFFGTHTRIGRIDRVFFKLAADMYDNYEEALEEKLGVFLIEGRNAEISMPETSWEPNIIEEDNGDVLIGWDLAMDAEERFTYNKPEVNRHFNDQDRLNDISGFVIFALTALHVENIVIEGRHFLEVGNNSPYYQAINQGQNVWKEGLDVNFSNRPDFNVDSYTISNFDNMTITDSGTFSITTIDEYDGVNTMTVDDVPIIIVDEEDPLLVFDVVPPILIPADGGDWYDAITVEYGGQAIAKEDLDNLLEYSFEILGDQMMKFTIFNAEDEHLVRVTNQGVTISEPVQDEDYELVIGTLLGLMVDHEEDDVEINDVMEGPQNEWYGEFKFLNTDAEIALNEDFFFEGSVQDMIFDVSVLGHEPTGEGTYGLNRFRFVLTTIEGDEIPESVRYYDLDENSETVLIVYEYMSGYRATGFKLSVVGINDLLFVQKFTANGFFYYDSYYSYEQQAMMFAKSFLAHTDGLQGASQDGTCVWPEGDKWSMLADEYGFMNSESQNRFEQNSDYSHSSLIDQAIERYVYLRNNDGVAYAPFLNTEPPGSLASSLQS
jgi:hypothetical protein